MKIKLQNIPTSLNECTLGQLINIVRISNDNINNDLNKLRIFYILIDNQGNVFDKINYLFRLSFVPWYAKTKLAKFLHDEKYLNFNLNVPEFDLEYFSAIIEDITAMMYDEENTLTKMKFRFNDSSGPGDYFENLDFQTFRFTDSEFYYMLELKEQTGEIKVTDDFIRYLYNIPPSYKLKLSPEIRQIILMYYIGNRKQLEYEFPFVFKKSKGTSTLNSYEEMWENILDAIAEKPQEYNNVDMLNVRSVLKNLNRKIELNQPSEQK